MSKSFKSEIKKRYEGRGNTWVKVPKDHVVYSDIINLISFSLNHGGTGIVVQVHDLIILFKLLYLKPNGGSSENPYV